MTGKRKVLISGIAVAVIAVFFVIAMPDWFTQRGATEAKDAREDKAPDFVLKDVPTLILLDKEGMIAGGQRFIDQILAKMFEGKEFSMQTSSISGEATPIRRDPWQ
jgi:hypothetical protein